MSKPTEKTAEGRGGTGVATFEDIEVRRHDPAKIADGSEDANVAFKEIEDTLERAVEAGQGVEDVVHAVRGELDSLKDGIAKLTARKPEADELSRKATRLIDDAPTRLVDEQQDLTFAERVCQVPKAERGDVEQISELCRLNDRMVYVGMWAKANGIDYRRTKTWQRYTEAVKRVERGYGADSTSGEVLLPTLSSSDFDDILEQKPGAASYFPKISMASKTYKKFRRTARGKAWAAPDNSAEISQAVTLANDSFAAQTYTAETLVAGSFIDREWTEDQMVFEVPDVMGSQAEMIRQAQSDTIWNGHEVSSAADHFEYVAGSSNVYAVTNDLDARTQHNGIRRYLLNVSSAALKTSMAALYLDLMTASMTAQGIFGMYAPNRVIWAGPINVWGDLVNLLSDSTNNTLVHATWGTYGPGAFANSGTLGDRGTLPGQVGTFLGSPFIATEHLCGVTNDSGIYDGSTTDNTQLLRIVPEEFTVAERQGTRQYFSSEQGLMMLKDYVQSEYRYDFLPNRGALSATYAPAHLFYHIDT